MRQVVRWQVEQPAPSLQQRARWVWAVAWVAAWCGALWAANAAAEPSNGDVTLGRKASGAKVPAQAPLHPLLVVVDSPYEVFDDAGSLIHVAAWTPDGKPAASAQVFLGGQLIGQTDAHGVLAFRWGVIGKKPDDFWTEGSLISVRLLKGGRLHGGDVPFSAYRRTESFESDQLYVYTDRGVYEPGEQVQLRSIAWHIRQDYTPLRGAEVEYLLTGPGGEVVAGALAKTDAWGIAHSGLALPPSAEEGIYTLSVSYGDATADARLRVERFVAPALDIQHTLGRYLTPDTSALSWTVRAAYFTGGAPVRVKVEVSFWARGALIGGVGANVSGAAPVEMEAGPQLLADIKAALSEGDFLEARVEVTDDQGRSDKLTRELRYTANPYSAVIELDRDAYSPGDAVEVVARLSDLDRVPVRGQAVRLVSSQGDAQTVTSDERGTAHFSLKMGDAGFEVEVFLEGVAAPLATTWVGWQEPQPMRSHVAKPVLVEGMKAPIEVRFPATFKPLEQVVHVDVVDTSGSIVQVALLPIKEVKGEQVAVGELTVPAWGSMLVTMFCVGEDTGDAAGLKAFADAEAAHAVEDKARVKGGEPSEGLLLTRVGLMTEGQNLIVHPGRQLKLTLDGLPDVTAPAGAVAAQVRVTDQADKPVQAALGVAVVDEAVLSLKDPLEVTPMDRFYNPQLRVLSTTGSEILTWPVVSRNWGWNQNDIALPPFPWCPPGDIAPALPGAEILADAGGSSGTFGVGSASYGAGGGGGGVGYGKASGVAKMAAPGAWDADGLVGGGVGGLSISGGGIGGGGGAPPPPPDPAADAAGSAAAPAARASRDEPSAAPVITIRTDFPKTSLWAPDRVTDAAGKAPLAFHVPDAITRQQVLIVASDARGGVGVLRHSVPVTQPLFVRADLPATLSLGDAVEVQVSAQNLTDAEAEVVIDLASPDLLVSGKPQMVTVAPGGAGTARFTVTAQRAGAARYTASAQGGGYHDAATHTLHVHPSGAPDIHQWSAALSLDAPFIQPLTVPADAERLGFDATLSVAFPALSGAFGGLDALRDQLLSERVLDRSAGLIAATLLWRARRDLKAAPPATLDAERQALLNDMRWLIGAQRPDGGWGFWWHAQDANPYLTAYCVEALIELHGAGLPIDPDVIRRASAYLASARTAADGAFSTAAIAFWEGSSDAVREGVTAEVFAILSRAPADHLDPTAARMLAELATRYRAYLDDPTPDVLTFAHALDGLTRLARTDRGTLTAQDTLRWVERLDSLRRTDHWEPSWFNAYGGTIEATVVTLRLLSDHDPARFARARRDATRYLLSTRDGWGGWHNPRGTAAAIRGLLLLGAGQKEEKAAVLISVDGALVRSVDIDPADPFMSAISLRALDLTPHLPPGDHVVEVRYTGKLTPGVSLTTRRWPAPDAAATPRTDLSVRAHITPASPSLRVGQPLTLHVELTSTLPDPRPALLDLPLPGGATLSPSDLATLRAHPEVLFADLDGHTLRCALTLTERATLDLPLTAARLTSPAPLTVAARWATDPTPTRPALYTLQPPPTTR